MSVATEEVGVTKEVVLSPPPSPTPVTCTPLPEDMALRVEPVSSMTVWGEIEGLQPGEKPIVIFRTEAPGRGLRTVVGPFKPVGSKGRLTFRQTGLDPLRGATTNRWEVKVVHARGVACTEVTLPNK